jgi:iron complex outermembrane receptor protein
MLVTTFVRKTVWPDRVAVRLAVNLAAVLPAVVATVVTASDCAMAQDAPAPPTLSGPAATSPPLIHRSAILPTITIYGPHRRKPRAAHPAAPPPAQAPPEHILRDGPPVQQTTAGPVRGYRALTSVSATGTSTPIERIPQAVVVIPRAVIEDQRPLSQSDALINVSGVSGMPAKSLTGYAFKVRGFPADRYVDGLSNYGDGGDNRSLVNTERIEVLKGPAGILYQAGLGPVGGIINTVSKLPTPNRFAEAGVMAGSYGLWNPWIDVNQPLNAAGTALFRFTGDYEASRDYVDVVERKRYSLNPTFRFDNRDGTVLTLQGSFSSRTFTDYAGLPGAGTVDRSAFSIRDNLYPADPNMPNSRTTYNGVTARLDHEFNDVWSMNASARVGEFSLFDRGQFLLPGAGPIFQMFNFNYLVDVRELSSNVNLVAKSSFGPVRNVLLLGADYNGVTDHNRAFRSSVPGFANLANPAFPPYTVPDTPMFNASNTYQNSGLTAQLQSTLWERLHLLAGVRAAHVRVHATDSVAQTDFITDEWKPLPRLGAVFDLMPGVSVFAGYSEGFRGVPFFNSTTAPKPEEAEQTEGGLKLVLPSGFAGTLSFFTITRRNVANLLPGNPLQARQVGEQRSEGFDLDLTWQPLPGLSILGSYAHINATVVEDQIYAAGNTIERVPRDSGRLWANYKIQQGPLRDVAIGAGLYAASPQASALDNLYFTPGFVTFDGKIGYETKQWSVALVGRNLADQRYFIPFPAGNGLIAPADPRTVYAVAKLKY